MTSLWLDRSQPIATDPLPTDGSFEIVVVGAGLTGLTTAALLARAGRRVGVVEARRVGAVTTGRTTAKVSLLQATKLQGILAAQTEHRARAYVEANREGLAWITRFCDDHGVDYQRRTAVTYAAKPEERRTVRQEYDAAQRLGLDVHWEETLDVPFPTSGAVCLDDQAQFDPMDVLTALAGDLRAHGGTLHEGHRVVSATKVGRPELRLSTGETLHADHVVLATGVPILDRAATFAKVEPMRSYLLSYTGVPAPEGMYISAGSDSRSLRDVPLPDGTSAFLVGGSGHSVGRTSSEESHLDDLRGWTDVYFPGAQETHAWSAQDYSSYDGLPLFGKLPLGLGRYSYATGFDKWGMTNAVASALYLSAQLLGGRTPDWGRALDHRAVRPKGALQLAEMNAKVGLHLTEGWARAEAGPAPDDVPEGTGEVGRNGLLPTGVSTLDGETCALVAVCTHVGGALKWNDAEKSWDCPLHGSRFAPDGSVLEGPATRPLKRLRP